MSTFPVQKSLESERVPFRLAGGRNPLILVPTHVNGKGPYDFILDTGASHSLLSQKLADLLELRPESEKQAMGAGGPVTLGLGRVGSIAVGSARQHDVSVGITSELERVANALQCRIDGDLGFDFLKDFSLTIVYTASTLQFTCASESNNSGPLANATPFTLAKPHKPLVLVPVTVNNQGPFQFALDTGASRTMLSAELAQKLALETIDDDTGTGVGGHLKVLASNVSSLAIGDSIVHGHTVGIGEFLAMLSAAAGTHLDGIVGYNFLNQFRVTIDYPRRTLTLAPNVQ